MNSADSSPSGTPRASASSGCRLANSSGRAMSARPTRRDHRQAEQDQTVCGADAEHVAEQQVRRLPA